MKLKDIPRTATFTWDQSSSSNPLLATGAVAGALDESFSNESQLEIWAPDFGGQSKRLGESQGSITVSSRFNRLAWSSPSTANSKGVLAAGMETGEVNVYDPDKILSSSSDARIWSSDKHTGPVRGLDFNSLQKNLLLSGAINAELYIHDLNSPTSPIPPGPLSTKLNEITSLQWNPTVSRVFAASSSSGFTSVWDLKAGKEIVSLQYGGGAAKGMDVVAGAAGLQMGKRRGMSDVCWHPEQATRLITASEDDESPIIMLWDLRNTRAPERILSGHHKGVLSVSWCRQDADLLLSCGKDNRTLCWNPQTGDIIGELPASNDWSFQTTWCPRNPDLLATASFDGHIGIHSLQTTTEPAKPDVSAASDDIFGSLGDGQISSNVLSLKQPPKWLRRPVSATFGFGGLLTITSNLPGASGKHQSGVVHIRHIVTEQSVLDRATALEATEADKDRLAEFCSSKEGAAWRTLSTLFKADGRDELISILGFSKEEVTKQVKYAIQDLPDRASTPKPEPQSRAEPDTASEIKSEDEQIAFDDDSTTGVDFFSSMTLRNPQLDSIIPRGQTAASSVGATIGSRPSSVRSETLKDHTFHIYPEGESDIDRLVTQALVLGNFSSAVDLCLAADRFADALLLAVRGGPDLLASTQKAYFAKNTTTLPFLRVFQSIVTEDLVDIVQNADLAEWKVAFAVICTFAKDAEFSSLAEQLGQRLYFRWQTLNGSDSPEAKASAKAARSDATLCFLAARRLEKVVNIWTDEMRYEQESSDLTRYSAHAHALQSFIEKVAVFTAATGYVDQDLSHPTESAAAAEAGARSYKLASLYDQFYEYADLLATQGQLDLAAKFVRMTPSDYKGSGSRGELDKARERVLSAASASEAPKPKTGRPTAPAPRALAIPFSAPVQAQAPAYVSSSGYEPAPTLYTPDPLAAAPSTYTPEANTYKLADTQPYYSAPPQQPLAPPPRVSAPIGPPPVPAAQRRDIPGWNDAPSVSAPKRPQSAAKESRPAPIMSPFPMSEAYTNGNQPPQSTPPRNAPSMLPPPPKGGPRPPSAQAVAQTASTPPPPRAGPPPSKPPVRAGPPPNVLAGPPPRVLSPLGPGRTPPPPRAPSRQADQKLAGPPSPDRAPSHPAGDRSHIPAASQPIYNTLSSELERVKQSNFPANIKRIVDDTDRRLSLLFDALKNDTVTKEALGKLSEITKAITARDMNGALALHVQLLTNATGDMSTWAPGVKQLIRLGL